MKKTTIKDVAKYTGVSVGTVSMALNDSEKISEKTKQIVREAAEKLNFKKNPFATSLSTQRSKTIGCIVPDITNQFYGEMVGFLQKYLEEYGYGLIIGFAKGNSKNEEKLIKQFIDRGVDGIISVPVDDPDYDIAPMHKLLKDNFPLVFIAAYYKEIPYYTVMSDLEGGMYQLTSEFLKKGYRDIVCLIGEDSLVPSADRILGFKRAFEEFGIPIDSSSMLRAEGVTFLGGYSAMIEKMIKQNLPEIIFTINDIMAMGVISALKSNGLRIPEDIQVAGFDDISIASYLETPLTTVHQPLDQMCKDTVALLMKRLAGEYTFDGIKKLPTSVVVRKSAS